MCFFFYSLGALEIKKKTIILLTLVGYELIIVNLVLPTSLNFYYLVPNIRSWNNIIVKLNAAFWLNTLQLNVLLLVVQVIYIYIYMYLLKTGSLYNAIPAF